MPVFSVYSLPSTVLGIACTKQSHNNSSSQAFTLPPLPLMLGRVYSSPDARLIFLVLGIKWAWCGGTAI